MPGEAEGAKHLQYFSLHVRFRESFEIRHLGEARMALAFGNFDAGVNVDQAFVEPFAIAPKNRVAGIDPRVGFALLDRDIDFRTGETDDESWDPSNRADKRRAVR